MLAWASATAASVGPGGQIAPSFAGGGYGLGTRGDGLGERGDGGGIRPCLKAAQPGLGRLQGNPGGVNSGFQSRKFDLIHALFHFGQVALCGVETFLGHQDVGFQPRQLLLVGSCQRIGQIPIQDR